MSPIFLSANQVASVVNCDPQCLRSQAKTNPSALGFPVTVIGHRVRIPRVPFLNYMGLSEEELNALLLSSDPAQEAANA